MDRLKSILVAASVVCLDLPMLEAAVAFAAKNEAELGVLDVFEPLARWHQTVNVEGQALKVQEMMIQDRRERLQDLLEEAGGVSDMAVDAKIGKPFIEVVHHVLRHGCDLVIVGEPEPSKHIHRGISPSVMQLLRKCPVPVWVLRPAAKLRLLALVDPDSSDPVRDSLNDLVLELATSMARREGGELHVATAWDLPGESQLRTSAYVAMPSMELDMMLQATSIEHQARLEALTDRHGVADVGGRVHLIKGPADQVLPALAEDLDITLIVMGTVARTGLSGLIMGNTAETVLRSVSCSVLALKPKGFVSPVRLDVADLNPPD